MTFYVVEFTVTGHGVATVDAESQEEAEDKAQSFDVIPHSDVLLEWECDEIKSVREDDS